MWVAYGFIVAMVGVHAALSIVLLQPLIGPSTNKFLDPVANSLGIPAKRREEYASFYYYYPYWLPHAMFVAVALVALICSNRRLIVLGLSLFYTFTAIVQDNRHGALEGSVFANMLPENMTTVALGLMLVLILRYRTSKSKGLPYNPYREDLIEFYKLHNPSNLKNVEKLLIRYAGREDILFDRLRDKYMGSKDANVRTQSEDEERGFSEEDDYDSSEEEEQEQPQRLQQIQYSPESSGRGSPARQSPLRRRPAASASATRTNAAAGAARGHVDGLANTKQEPTVRSAIEEMRREQQRRIDERIAQLKAAKR